MKTIKTKSFPGSLFVTLLLTLIPTLSWATIDGPSSVGIGSTQTYTYDNGSTYIAPSWTASLGSVLSSSVSGTTYTVTIHWGSTTGSGSVTFKWKTFTVETKSVTVVGATMGGSGSYCLGNAEARIFNSVSGSTYQLYKNGSAVIPNKIGTGSTLTWPVTQSGTYTAIATPGGAVAGSAVITIDPGPAQYSIGTTNYCGGTRTITLSNSETNAVYFLLKNGTIVGGSKAGTGSAISWTGLMDAGTYTVNGQGGDGCTTTMTGTVSISLVPSTPPAITSVSICGPGTVTITGTAGANGNSLKWYSASSGGTALATGLSYSPSISSTRTYYASTYNTSSGCESVSRRSVVATVKPVPTVDATIPADVCSGEAFSIHITNPNNLSGTTYSWTFTGVHVTGGSNGTGSNINQTLVRGLPSGIASGTYTIIATNNGCASSTITRTVTLKAQPVVTSADVHVCSGSYTSILLTNDLGLGSYTWTVPSQVNASGATAGTHDIVISQLITGSPGGTVTYRVKANVFGCDGPTKDVIATVRTNGNPVTVTKNSRFGPGQVTIEGQGATNYGWYAWGGGAQVTPPAATYTPPAVTSTVANYGSVRGIDSYGCVSTSYTNYGITIEPLPVIYADDNAVAFGTPLQLSTDPYTTYYWEKLPSTPEGSTQAIDVTEPGSYKLTVTKAGINGSGSATKVITSQLDGMDMNYVISNTILTKNVTSESAVTSLPVTSVNQSIQYIDGIGRPLQTVVTQGSTSKHDIVQAVSYDDGSGKELFKYLPFVKGASGRYKDDFVPKEDTVHYATAANPQFQFYQGTSMVASDPAPYTKTTFETSLLNRPVKETGAGQDWSANDKSIVYAYLVNLHGTSTSANQEKIISWKIDNTGMPVRYAALNSGYYPTGSLIIRSITDEQGNEVREYADILGRVVAKKVYVTGTTNVFNTPGNRAETDYVYNDLGQLVFVIQPELANTLLGNTLNPTSTQLNNFAFQYTYDGLGRMISKRVPGADWVYMVYDNRDRLVMTQDGVQRTNNKWTFTKYDYLNRPVITGIYSPGVSITQQAMTTSVTGSPSNETLIKSAYSNNVFPTTNTELLTITFYDNYSFLQGDTYFSYKTGRLAGQETVASTRVLGQVTGTWTKVLGQSKQWLRSVNYYDDRNRTIQVIADNHKRGLDVVTSIYDFSGKVIDTKTEVIDHHVNWTALHSNAWPIEDKFVSKGGSTTSVYGYSVQQFAANTDGWVEFSCSDPKILSERTFGFAVNTLGGALAYGIRQNVDASLATTITVTEGGVDRSTSIPVVAGDIIRIERFGMKVLYKRNGATFDSTALSTRPLIFAQVLVKQNDADLFNPKISTDGPVKSVSRHFDYDHAGRLLKTWHSIDNGTMVLLSKQEYNELGQLVDKKVHSIDSVNFHQSTDYRYNIRGWLTSMNGAELASGNGKNIDTSNDRKDLFGMDLLYNDVAITGFGNTKLYNGNIAAMRWSNNLGMGEEKQRGYKFDYDAMNRLTAASQKVNSVAGWTSVNSFHESGLTYDLNGNINTLLRTDETGATMDSLHYKYGYGEARGNVLNRVNDSGTAKGFINGTNTDNDYAYDSNGNLTLDKNKSITSITYNHLNLPEKVTKSTGDYVFYTYDATGRKLEQDVYDNANLLKKRSDYLGEWFYENDTLRFLNHEEGRSVTEGSWVNAPQLLPDSAMASASNYFPSGTSNVTISAVASGSQSYIKVLANVNASTPGFVSQFIDVVPGRTYTLRVKGYSTNAAVALYALGGSYASGDILWPGPFLPSGSQNEAWVEAQITVPTNMRRIRVGAIYRNSVTAGDAFYINTMQLYEYNPTHGNAVYAQSGYTYQYNLKDHLGNVRLTFTTKDEVDSAKATLEHNHAAKDASNFLNYDKARLVYGNLFDRTNGSSPGYAQRLSGVTGEEVGLAKSISVMPGDIIKADVYAKYFDVPSNPNTLPAVLQTLVANLANPASSGGAVIDGFGYGSGSVAIPGLGGVTNLGDDEEDDAPNAYLAYIYMDRNFDPASLRFKTVSLTEDAYEDGIVNGDHELLSLIDTVKEAGYVYVYLKNDELGREVYFDDFMVEHVKSPVVSSQDYYPYGLTYNSYSREDALANQYQYNGKERQDELEIGWLDYGLRSYEPSLARWNVQDSRAEKYSSWSPYNYVLGNPLSNVDPKGDTVTIQVTNTVAGKTDINLYTAGETTGPNAVAQETTEVNVYEVNVSNEDGSSAKFYYTRDGKRKNASNTSAAAEDVTFDVQNDGDSFQGKIKSRWSGTDNVLELRKFDDNTDNEVEAMKGGVNANRTAIQFHVKGATDGCLMAVGSGQFNSTTEGVTVDNTNLSTNSTGSQANFMQKVKDFRQADVDAGKSDFIKVSFQKN